MDGWKDPTLNQAGTLCASTLAGFVNASAAILATTGLSREHIALVQLNARDALDEPGLKVFMR